MASITICNLDDDLKMRLRVRDARLPGFFMSGSMLVLDINVASELMRPRPTAAVAAWIAELDARDMYRECCRSDRS